MNFQVDLDRSHSVIRVTVFEEAVSLECAENIYECLSRLASSGGPYAAIYDLSMAKCTSIPRLQQLEGSRSISESLRPLTPGSEGRDGKGGGTIVKCASQRYSEVLGSATGSHGMRKVEPYAIERVDAIAGPDAGVDAFLASNELWGGSGSIADCAGGADRSESRRKIERVLLELGMEQIRSGM